MRPMLIHNGGEMEKESGVTHQEFGDYCEQVHGTATSGLMTRILIRHIGDTVGARKEYEEYLAEAEQWISGSR